MSKRIGALASWASGLLGEPVDPGIELDDAPASERAASDWCASGAAALTGRADGPPLVAAGGVATAALGAQLAFAAAGGPGYDGSWHHLLGERAALSLRTRRAPWSVGGACRAVAARDGWVALTLARTDDIELVPALVQSAVGDDAWAAVTEWAAVTTVDDVQTRAALFGLPCAPIPRAGRRPALARRTSRAVTPPVRTLELRDCAPTRRPPVVVDFSALWAGPLCAQLLGTAGAHVVKVESLRRLDSRGADPPFYDLLHAGHDSVLVDPDDREDRNLIGKLVEQADIVVEGSRPRALRAWGLHAEAICARSATTWVSITAYGRTRPDRVGFGDDVALAAGAVAWEGGGHPPAPCADALADPLTGMHAAVLALASHHRGGGRLLDIAMVDIVAAAVRWHPTVTTPANAPVSAPVARPVQGVAAAAGRDTESWRVA